MRANHMWTGDKSWPGIEGCLSCVVTSGRRRVDTRGSDGQWSILKPFLLMSIQWLESKVFTRQPQYRSFFRTLGDKLMQPTPSVLAYWKTVMRLTDWYIDSQCLLPICWHANCPFLIGFHFYLADPADLVACMASHTPTGKLLIVSRFWMSSVKQDTD